MRKPLGIIDTSVATPERNHGHEREGSSRGHAAPPYVWFEESKAVTPLPVRQAQGLPETYPFGV
ncbi:MAG: hypothetical protein JO357_01310 [Hyphomicrobiales bacterium]|nr:hypothetical protein [Hyphomicrobiales bacterium]